MVHRDLVVARAAKDLQVAGVSISSDGRGCSVTISM
jgi:hypothetical protein